MNKRVILSFTFAVTALCAVAADRMVSFSAEVGAVSLKGATVGCDAEEYAGVLLAVENLCTDIGKVVGQKPEKIAGRPTILIGTVGKNRKVDELLRSGRLGDLKGKTEQYVITVVDGQVVIAGSDKRGTIYGVYELSRQIGVSPWYYWADVPVERREDVFVRPGRYTDGEPAVRYRGLFLNDEAPCLTSWVKNTFGTGYGDHRFYAKVFELILRLKGNMLWPAMWGWAFYADDPENSRVADEMGIIIGTSHHEPMARNHQEWARKRHQYGAWNYQTNQAVIDHFFREGIERMKHTEDIVTIGMRGDGDEAMSEEADTRLLQRIVDRQRKIISSVTGRPAKNTPQVWALYKEVLDYYDKGMRVPQDVIMLLCDDNWGNLRRVPTAKERKHPGGWGLYYHVDYVGAPRNSKWLNATPTQNMWEQLHLAYANGIDRMWILNVGDLKPMEYPISFFLDMAWAPDAYRPATITEHTRDFCRQQFGEAQADEAARILNLCCKYNGRSTAEMLDSKTYNVDTGEWRQVADDYMRLEAEALRQYLTLPEACRDAYQQLILFPVQAMSNLHQMYYAQAMNHRLYAANDPDANLWAGRVEQAFRRDSLLCAGYNHTMAGGKWNGMMTQKHIGYTGWNDNFPHDRLPAVYRIARTGEDTRGAGGFVFTEKDSVVVMEAEHYYTAEASGNVQWTVMPYMGRTRSGMTLMPYTEPVGGASLEYRFSLGRLQPDSVTVHIAVKSTLDYLNKGGLTYTVALDGGTPQRICFNGRLNEHPANIYTVYYPTVARRVVVSSVTLPLAVQGGEHRLVLRPDDPAIVFEKVVVDAGGYKPSYLMMDESPYRRDSK